RGARHRPRIPSAVWEIWAEHFSLVRNNENIVVGRALGEDRHLLLDLLLARVRASRLCSTLIFALLDDGAPEALGGPVDGIEISEVLGEDALHHEPALPFLPHEILRERIGQHVEVRRRVQHISAAVFLAKIHVLGSYVEQQHVLAFDRVRETQQRVGWRIDQNEMVAAVGELLQRRNSVAANGNLLHLEGELLLGETPRGVVVLQGDLCARDTEILWLDVQPRQGEWPLHLLLEIADRHGRETCVCRRRRCGLGLRGLLRKNRQPCREKAQRSQDCESEAVTHVVNASRTCDGARLQSGANLPARSRAKQSETHASVANFAACSPDWALTIPFIDKSQCGAQSFSVRTRRATYPMAHTGPLP